MGQSWLADLLVGEGSIKSLVALAKAVCDVPGKTAELLSAQVRPYHHLPVADWVVAGVRNDVHALVQG